MKIKIYVLCIFYKSLILYEKQIVDNMKFLPKFP